MITTILFTGFCIYIILILAQVFVNCDFNDNDPPNIDVRGIDRLYNR